MISLALFQRPSLSSATLVGCLLFVAVCQASEYQETKEFADAAARITEYAEHYGAANTLLVVDIDNTLLAMSHPLGSDQWFEWQKYLQKHEPESPALVASTFEELLTTQGLLFTIGKMQPPQPDLPGLIEGVQSLSVPTLVLTSRGDDFRIATERELKANGYDFACSALKIKESRNGRYAPYKVGNWKSVGLSAEEAKLYKLEPPRPVSFSQGVYMTAGQHKGAMLLLMLEQAVKKPRAVVFVDDHGRHVHRVYDALTRRGIEVSVFHYHREDDNVSRFRYSDKKDVNERWHKLSTALGEVYALPESETIPAASTP